MVTVVCVRVVTVINSALQISSSGYCDVYVKEVTVIGSAIGGLQKSGKFIRSGNTFKGNGLLLILMIFYIQTDGYLII